MPSGNDDGGDMIRVLKGHFPGNRDHRKTLIIRSIMVLMSLYFPIPHVSNPLL